MNQTSNESPKRFLSECPEHQRNGNLRDIQVLQCVNSTSEITRHERSDEQEQNSNETLGSGLNHSMKSWFDIPLSKIVTEPLNSQIRNQVGLSSFSHFFPEIGSGFLENTVPHNFSMLKNHCSPADFTQKLPENLRQHVSNSLHCQQNSDVHSLAQQQFVALGDAMNISATKSNSANGKEPIISRISDEYREVRTSPGELIQGTFSLERSRKRKRREEDEIIKSPLQRKMEHLHKEKERRCVQEYLNYRVNIHASYPQ